MAPTKALRARDAAPSASAVTTDKRLPTTIDAEQSAPLWKVLLALAGAFSVTFVMAYGVTDFLVRWRQKKVDDEYAEEQELRRAKGELQQRAWRGVAKKNPEIFLEKVVLRKNPGSTERRAAIRALLVANPEWAKENRILLSGIQFRNGTTLTQVKEDSRNGTARMALNPTVT